MIPAKAPATARTLPNKPLLLTPHTLVVGRRSHFASGGLQDMRRSRMAGR